MAHYLGEIAALQTVYGDATFVDSTGLPTALVAGSAAVLKLGTSNLATRGVGAIVISGGLATVPITTANATDFFVVAQDYLIFIASGTVNGTSVVGYPLGRFSMGNRTLGAVSGAVGSVTGIAIKKNTALANFPFFMVLSSDHVTPATGLTVAVARSIDGGAFGASTNTPATEISAGCYKISLSAADLNGTTIILKMTAATADQRTIIIATEP